MKRYHYKVYTGPTTVKQIADKLRTSAMPWQNVTIEGTEHVHYSIDALYEHAAAIESAQWFVRAGFGPTFSVHHSLLRAETICSNSDCPQHPRK